MMRRNGGKRGWDEGKETPKIIESFAESPELFGLEPRRGLLRVQA